MVELAWIHMCRIIYVLPNETPTYTNCKLCTVETRALTLGHVSNRQNFTVLPYRTFNTKHSRYTSLWADSATVPTTPPIRHLLRYFQPTLSVEGLIFSPCKKFSTHVLSVFFFKYFSRHKKKLFFWIKPWNLPFHKPKYQSFL